jgi:hypothetical protein
METLPDKQENKLPSLQDILSENEVYGKSEALNAILNAEPPAKWVKVHPFITDWKYIPIDKIEYLLRKVFKSYKIEILREGTAFNGVFVVVRIHYLNPATNQMDYHDGIGACQLQTKKGTSPADLANINNGAVSMAFPIAKTFAVKDACDHFGKLFGSDLNRKDTVPFQADAEIINRVEQRKKLLQTKAK